MELTNKYIRLYGIVDDSIVDGPGLRFAIFVQGCPHHCIGCHNPQSHDINGGYLQSLEDIFQKIKDNPLLDGVTLSGGEPFLQAERLVPLVQKIKTIPLNVMIYSGYTFEEIQNLDDNAKKLLELCDVLVDGRFILEKRSLSLLYKGSSNQRIIDIQKTLKMKKIVEQKIGMYGEFIE